MPGPTLGSVYSSCLMQEGCFVAMFSCTGMRERGARTSKKQAAGAGCPKHPPSHNCASLRLKALRGRDSREQAGKHLIHLMFPADCVQTAAGHCQHFTSTAWVQLMPKRCELPSLGRASQVQWDETVLTRSISAIRSCYTEKEIQIVTSHLLLMRGGDLRHMGGGGSILLGGLKRLGGGLGRGASTAVAVISCPSIWPLHEITEIQ